jgi:hypothetical protein
MTDHDSYSNCERCGSTISLDDPHTEIVRRDFVDRPEPATVERLCLDCWRRYVEGFLGAEFDREIEAT